MEDPRTRADGGTEEDADRKRFLLDLVTSEKSYFESLNVLNQVHITPLSAPLSLFTCRRNSSRI